MRCPGGRPSAVATSGRPPLSAPRGPRRARFAPRRRGPRLRGHSAQPLATPTAEALRTSLGRRPSPGTTGAAPPEHLRRAPQAAPGGPSARPPAPPTADGATNRWRPPTVGGHHRRGATETHRAGVPGAAPRRALRTATRHRSQGATDQPAGTDLVGRAPQTRRRTVEQHRPNHRRSAAETPQARPRQARTSTTRRRQAAAPRRRPGGQGHRQQARRAPRAGAPGARARWPRPPATAAAGPVRRRRAQCHTREGYVVLRA